MPRDADPRRATSTQSEESRDSLARSGYKTAVILVFRDNSIKNIDNLTEELEVRGRRGGRGIAAITLQIKVAVVSSVAFSQEAACTAERY